jgi:hypothetical protein
LREISAFCIRRRKTLSGKQGIAGYQRSEKSARTIGKRRNMVRFGARRGAVELPGVWGLGVDGAATDAQQRVVAQDIAPYCGAGVGSAGVCRGWAVMASKGGF